MPSVVANKLFYTLKYYIGLIIPKNKEHGELIISFMSMIATLAAAFAGYWSFQTQNSQSTHETIKYLSESYGKYSEIPTRNPELRTKPSPGCYKYIVKNLKTAQFKKLLKFNSDLSTKLSVGKLERLILECINGDEHKYAEHNADKIALIYDKISLDLKSLDRDLILYYARIGNRGLICEYYSGFLLAGRGENIRFAGRGEFIMKAIKHEEISASVFPNLVAFAKDISRVTDNFQEPAACDQIAAW